MDEKQPSSPPNGSSTGRSHDRGQATTPATATTTTTTAATAATPKPKSRRGRRPRDKDAPRRPLSAYNIFFRDERQKLLADMERGELAADYRAHARAFREKRGSSGSAKFQAIARTVAARWRALSEEERKPFAKQAAQEMSEYKVKKEAYNRRQAEKQNSAQKNGEDEPSAASKDDIDDSGGPKRNRRKSSTGGAAAAAAATKKKPAARRAAATQSTDSTSQTGQSQGTTNLPMGGMGSSLLFSGSAAGPGLPTGPFHVTEIGGQPIAGIQASMLRAGGGGGGGGGFYPSAALRQANDAGGRDMSFMLSLQDDGLRRREQALFLAEQRLQEEQRLRGYLALQQQQQQRQSALLSEEDIRARLSLQGHPFLLRQAGQPLSAHVTLPQLQQQQQQQQTQQALPMVTSLPYASPNLGGSNVSLDLLASLSESERRAWLSRQGASPK